MSTKKRLKEENESIASGHLQASTRNSEKSAASRASGSLNQSNLRESLISVISDNGQPQVSSRKVKLPKLELRKFNGKVEDWPDFWDSFYSAIHNDDQLAEVDKFKYLRS